MVSQRVGRAEKADDTNGTHYSEFEVDLKPLTGAQAEFAQADIRNALVHIPGANFAVKTFLTERVEETLSGYTASVVVNVYGDDLDTLDAEAQRVAQTLRQVPGATEVQIQSPPGTPQIGVRLRPEALARWGFDAVDVLDAVQTAFQGVVVGQVYDGNRVFNVNVLLSPSKRESIADIRALPLRNAAGAFVRLGQLADVYATSGRYVVLHNGARRVLTITCNVAGRNVTSFVAAAKKSITRDVQLAKGNYVEFGGTAEAQAASIRDLIVHSVIAAVAIGLMLWIVLGHARNLVLVEGMAWGPDAAVRGAVERLTPILMTALATSLGLLPLAIGSGDPGREIEGPMALVILGGLFTSTALNLLVMPSLALRYGRFTETDSRYESPVASTPTSSER